MEDCLKFPYSIYFLMIIFMHRLFKLWMFCKVRANLQVECEERVQEVWWKPMAGHLFNLFHPWSQINGWNMDNLGS